MIDADRALRAFTDVLAVEYDEDTDMARIVTLSDCYDVDMRETRHVCPDREYNDVAICKHLVASEIVRGHLDVPGGWLVVENLDERTDDTFDIERPPRIGNDRTLDAFTDGGNQTDEIRIYGVRDDGRPRVERKRVVQGHSHTEARHDTLPPEFAAFVHGQSTAVADLPADVRAWIDDESSGDLETATTTTMQDTRVMTDGGQMEQKPEGIDKFTLWNAERENARHFDSKSEAEAKQDELSGLMDTELFPPGESPEALYHGDDADADTEACATCGDEVAIPDATTDAAGDPIHQDCPSRVNGVDVCVHCGDDIDDGHCPTCDRDDANEATDDHVAESIEQAADDSPNVDVVDHSPDEPADAPDTAPEPDAAHEPEVLSPDEVEQYAADLEDRDVGTDPLKWMPGEFVDEIDGTQAINRRGFEVLAHFYNVEVRTDIQVPPEDTGHEYCRVEATARTADGREVNAHGSAHLDRGDDSYLLLEMAETRARKRALSIATGSGAVAVSELQNEVQ